MDAEQTAMNHMDSKNFNYQEKICLNFEIDDAKSWFEEYIT